MVEKCPKLQSLNISHIIADPGEEMDLKNISFSHAIYK
jgi:hypothetical protein